MPSAKLSAKEAFPFTKLPQEVQKQILSFALAADEDNNVLITNTIERALGLEDDHDHDASSLKEAFEKSFCPQPNLSTLRFSISYNGPSKVDMGLMFASKALSEIGRDVFWSKTTVHIIECYHPPLNPAFPNDGTYGSNLQNFLYRIGPIAASKVKSIRLSLVHANPEFADTDEVSGRVIANLFLDRFFNSDDSRHWDASKYDADLPYVGEFRQKEYKVSKESIIIDLSIRVAFFYLDGDKKEHFKELTEFHVTKLKFKWYPDDDDNDDKPPCLIKAAGRHPLSHSGC